MCVTPTAKKEGFATIPNITWDDVGALEGIRDELTMAILVSVAMTGIVHVSTCVCMYI